MKRNMKQIVIMLVLICMGLGMKPQTTSAAPKKYVRSFSVGKKKISIKAGQSKKISYKIKVKGNASKKVSLKANNKKIQVRTSKNKIVILGREAGKSKITVTTKGKDKKGKKIKKTISVTVNPDSTGVTDNTDIADKDSALEEFAKNYQYLCKTPAMYDGYFLYSDTENIALGDLRLELQPLTYDIDDYDSDGQSELLIVNMDPYTKWGQSALRLQMYEVDGTGHVYLSALHLCTTEYGSIYGTEILRKGDSRVFKYKKDNEWMIAAEQNIQGSYFDGHARNLFMVAKYYDKPKLKFEVMGTAEGEWYPGTPDEQVIKSSMKQKYDALDLEVDVNQIFDGKKHVYDYIDNPISFVKTEYAFDRNALKQGKWSKFSYITFSEK